MIVNTYTDEYRILSFLIKRRGRMGGFLVVKTDKDGGRETFLKNEMGEGISEDDPVIEITFDVFETLMAARLVEKYRERRSFFVRGQKLEYYVITTEGRRRLTEMAKCDPDRKIAKAPVSRWLKMSNLEKEYLSRVRPDVQKPKGKR